MSGSAVAGTDFWVQGAYDDWANGPSTKTVTREDSVTYELYAKSKVGPFDVDVFLSNDPCSNMNKEYDVADHKGVFKTQPSTFYNVAAKETFSTDSVEPGNYKLCMVMIDGTSNNKQDIETLSLEVENKDPGFTNLQSLYQINEDDPANTLVIDNLDNKVYDSPGETLTISMESNNNPGIADCSIQSNALVCTPNSVGSTDVTLKVEDDYGASDTATVTVEVVGNNHAPYFQGLTTYYMMDLKNGQGNIFSVDLDNHGQDPDNHPLTYDYSESSSIVDCSMTGDVLSCDYVGSGGTGMVDVDVTVSDSSLQATETITINVTNSSGSGSGNGTSTQPQADIDAPSSAFVGNQVTFEADDSIGSGSSSIVNYEWDIDGSTYSGQTVTTSFSTTGTYVIELMVEDGNGKTDAVTHTIDVKQPNTAGLEVDYIRIDGEKHDPYDHTDQVLKVDRGQKLPIKVKVNANSDAENVQITSKLAGYQYSNYEQGKIFHMTDTFDLDKNRWDTREMELQVPMKIETGDIKLRIYVEDKNSRSYRKEYNLDITGVDESGAVQIREAYLNPSKEVLPGRALSALVKVENFGDKPLDDVTLTSEVPELNIRDTETLDELDVDEKETFERTLLRFPKDTEPGEYQVSYEVTFDEYERTTRTDTVTVLEGEVTSEDGKTMVNVPQSKQVTIGGGEALYPVSITNNGDTTKSYRLSASGVDMWGSYRFDSGSQMMIDAGESKTAYMYLSADAAQSPGVKSFFLNIESESTTKQVPLDAALVGGEDSSDDSGSSDVLFIVLSAIVLATIIGAIIYGLYKAYQNPEGGESEDKELDEGEEYY